MARLAALIPSILATVRRVTMTPEAALTAYVSFFVIKPDRATSIVMSIAMLFLITVVIGVVMLVSMAIIDHPLLRVSQHRPSRGRTANERDELPPPHGTHPKPKDHGPYYSRSGPCIAAKATRWCPLRVMSVGSTRRNAPPYVRYASNTDRSFASQPTVAKCQKRL